MSSFINYPCPCEEVEVDDFTFRFFSTVRDDDLALFYEAWLFHKNVGYAMCLCVVSCDCGDLGHFIDSIIERRQFYIDNFLNMVYLEV